MADYYKMSHNVPNETKKTHAFEEYEKKRKYKEKLLSIGIDLQSFP